VKKGIKTISMTISENLLERVQAYANSLNINRSAAISVLLSQALEYKEAISAVEMMPKLNEIMETMKQRKPLRRFEEAESMSEPPDGSL